MQRCSSPITYASDLNILITSQFFKEMNVAHMETGIESLAGPETLVKGRFRLTLVGEQACGKTSLIQALKAAERRGESNRSFSDAYRMTLGPEITSQSMTTSTGSVMLNIVDAPGLTISIQDDILIRRFVQDPDMLFAFVFDVNSPDSARGMEAWWKLIENSRKSIGVSRFVKGVIIATKSDFPGKSKDRQEAETIGKAFARTVGMDYYVTTSVGVDGVKEPFEDLVELAAVDQ